MSQVIKKARGKVKKVVGAVTGNRKLEREGKRDEAEAKVEGAVDDVMGSVKDAGSAIKDAVKN